MQSKLHLIHSHLLRGDKLFKPRKSVTFWKLHIIVDQPVTSHFCKGWAIWINFDCNLNLKMSNIFVLDTHHFSNKKTIQTWYLATRQCWTLHFRCVVQLDLTYNTSSRHCWGTWRYHNVDGSPITQLTSHFNVTMDITEDTAKSFLRRILPQHDLSNATISDRDPKINQDFGASFWTFVHLCKKCHHRTSCDR